MYTNASKTLNANAVSVTKSEKKPRHRNKQTNKQTHRCTYGQTDRHERQNAYSQLEPGTLIILLKVLKAVEIKFWSMITYT